MVLSQAMNHNTSSVTHRSFTFTMATKVLKVTRISSKGFGKVSPLCVGSWVTPASRSTDNSPTPDLMAIQQEKEQKMLRMGDELNRLQSVQAVSPNTYTAWLVMRGMGKCTTYSFGPEFPRMTFCQAVFLGNSLHALAYVLHKEGN